jgi:hypothetical protein
MRYETVESLGGIYIRDNDRGVMMLAGEVCELLNDQATAIQEAGAEIGRFAEYRQRVVLCDYAINRAALDAIASYMPEAITEFQRRMLVAIGRREKESGVGDGGAM